MSRLLSAGIARLRKSKVFYASLIVMAVYALMVVFSSYRSCLEYGLFDAISMDDWLYADVELFPIVCAVFIGLFIGTEYSDGTIRNKLVAGHSRWAIYISNLIVCALAAVLMRLVYMAVLLAVGLPLIGKGSCSITLLMVCFMCSILITVTFAAIFLMISMLVQSKAVGAVSVILLSVAFLFAAMLIYSNLNEPEYYEGYTYTYMDEEGQEQVEEVERERNPRYLTGTRRAVYEFLHDFLPYNQGIQIADYQTEHMAYFPLYSLTIILVSSVCGILLFRRKDLK